MLISNMNRSCSITFLKKLSVLTFGLCLFTCPSAMTEVTEQSTCYNTGHEESLPIETTEYPHETEDLVILMNTMARTAHIYNKNTGTLKKLDLPFKNKNAWYIKDTILDNGNIATQETQGPSKEMELILTNVRNGSSEAKKNALVYASKITQVNKELANDLSLLIDEKGNKKVICNKSICPSNFRSGNNYNQPSSWTKDGKNFISLGDRILNVSNHDPAEQHINQRFQSSDYVINTRKMSSGEKNYLINFKNGVSKEITFPSSYSTIASSTFTGNKGEKYVLVSQGNSLNYEIFNIDSGKIVEGFSLASYDLDNQKLEKEGRLCSKDACFLLEDNKVKTSPPKAETRLMQYQSYNGQIGTTKFYIQRRSYQCLDNQSFHKDINAYDCHPSLQQKKPVAAVAKETQPIFLQLLCLQHFNQPSWDLLTADIVDEDNSTESIKKSLLLFSKPQGFNSQKHLGRLISLIKMRSYEKFPAEFNNALMGILSQNSLLYEDLMNKHPELEASRDFKPQPSCRTPEEEEKVKKGISDYLNFKASVLLGKNLSNTSSETTEFFKKSKNLIAQLDPNDLDKFLEHLTSTLLLHPSTSAEISPVKLFKFIYRSLQKNLGLPYKDLTDITYVQNQDSIDLIQLSVNPTPDAEKVSAGGFYSKYISHIDKSSVPLAGKNIPLEWRYRNKKMQAEIQLDKLRQEDLVKFNKSPNYESMLEDKNLHGVVLFSSNLSKKEVDDTIAEYTRYYAQQGFKFSTKASLEVTQDFIDKGLSGKNNSFDYMIKEAHSQGAEDFLLKMASKSKVLRGVKEWPNGSKETIDLMVPASPDTIPVKSSGIGEKLKEGRGNSELLFINASCFSGSSLVMDASHIQNPNLVNIPAHRRSTVGTFVNHEKNSLKNIVDGIRNRESYEKIRERLQNSPGYKDQTSERFMFPDESEYQAEFSKAGMPVKVEVQMQEALPNGTKAAYPPVGDER